MKKILVLHGPNLNLLGEREPQIYGHTTLEQLNEQLRRYARSQGLSLKIFQSNHEGALIDRIQAERHWAEGIVINPGAFTHYSYALRDAIAAVALPTVEVHLSDIQHREEFRRLSVIAPVCITQISGQGPQGYRQALKRLQEHSGATR
ncbi:MAG TPA: type II 3-dehydroquinate dehydratase [Candidatus Fraserbacteria bacterium]|nr:type II 3-dehydroquinate dehydratase [Candidatus Fraserbacteria bacterium]